MDEGVDQRLEPQYMPVPRIVRVVAPAVVSVTAAVLAGMVLSHWLPVSSVSLVFLLGVLACAVGFGVAPAVLTAILSFLAYNFFFIEPRYTFTVADPQEVFALGVFLVVAVMTGSLAGRMREQADAARRSAETVRALYDFSGKLSGSSELEPMLLAIVAQASAMVRGNAVMLLRNGDDLSIRAASPQAASLNSADWQAAHWSLRRGETARAPAPGWPGAQFEFRPLKTARRTVGVVGIAPATGARIAGSEDEQGLEAILRHAAMAIERIELVSETTKARAAAEQERLRSALLSSLSHDLRTPLASILGAVTSLRQLGTGMPPESRDDLLAIIEEEGRHLALFVSNLLDMTRLEAGIVDARREWIDVGDAAHGAVRRARSAFPERHIEFERAPDLPLVRADAVLIEQVVFNLLDNAVKFSPPQARISVSLYREGDHLVTSVTDRGAGIPPHALERVFQKFYRVHSGNRAPRGTGLGLAICRGMLTALGGTIRAESPVENGRGTRIVVQLPAAEHPTAIVQQETKASS